LGLPWLDGSCTLWVGTQEWGPIIAAVWSVTTLRPTRGVMLLG